MTAMATQSVSSPSPSPKDIIIHLRSTATTNALTFKTLQALLGSRSEKPADFRTCSIEGVEGTKSRNLQARSGAVRTTKKQQSKQFPSSETYESSASGVKPLPSGVRRKVATEAFNAALKCITVAAKAKQDGDRDTGKTSDRQPMTTTRPLQPSSPNKQSKLPSYKCSSVVKSGDASAVADCAIVSLDCLYDLASQDDASSTGDTGLQKGAVILLEKLISMGYTPKALTQVSRLCEQYWKRRKGTECNSGCGRQTRQLPLILDSTLLDKSGFDFVSSYQSQALRLCIMLGAKVFSDEFVRDLQLATSGSPGRVILDGLKSGFISEEKAGNHLRTIAQALLKLSSAAISDKHARAEDCSRAFVVLVEALAIKCESWTRLHHEPDVDREFWSPFFKGLLRFESNQKHMTGQTSEQAIRLALSSSSVLRKNGYEAAMPANVVNKIIDIAEAADNLNAGLEFLQSVDRDTTRWTREQQLFCVWRLLAIHLKLDITYNDRLISVINETSRIFGSTKHTDIHHLEEMLLHGARLRKAIVTSLNIRHERKQHEVSREPANDIVKVCVQTLFDLSNLSLDILQSSRVKNDIQAWRSGYTSYARIFESIFAISKSCIEQKSTNDLSAAELDSLTIGSKSLMGLATVLGTGDEVTKFLEGLICQVSGLYWARYVDGAGDSIQLASASDLLRRACNTLQDLSVQTQHSAAYGTKLEKLAISHLTSRDTSAACRIFEAAVIYHIKLGALKEAAEAALSGSSQNVWSKQRARSYCLSRTLQSLTKLYLTYGISCSTSNTWIYDGEGLSATERTLLFECQLNSSTDHEFSKEQATACESRFHSLLELCEEPQLEVYRLRFVSNFMFVLAKNTSLSELVTISADVYLQFCNKPTNLSPETPLLRYHCLTHQLLQLQFLMSSERFEVEQLRDCVGSISDFLLGLPEMTRLEEHIDDLDVFVNQLRATFDVGKMMDDIELMRACLVCLKHILGICTEKHTPRLANVLIELAKLYHRTGKMTEAGKSFTAVELLFDEMPESSGVCESWALSYIEYLMDLPNMAKAVQMYDRVARSRGADPAREEESGRQRLERHFLTGRAALVASAIALNQGNPEGAYQFAKQAIKLSAEIWHVIETQRDQGNTSSICENDSSLHNMTAEMSNLTLSFEQPVMQRKAKGSAYWAYFDLHYSALLRMIDLSMHAGLYQDGTYYAEQLRTISGVVGSAPRVSRALSILALVKSRAGHETEAVNLLSISKRSEIVISCFEDQQNALWQAEAWIHLNGHEISNSLLETVKKSFVPDEAPAEISKASQTGIKKAPVRGRAKTPRPIKTPARRPGQKAAETTSQNFDTAQSIHASGKQQLLEARCQSLQDRISLAQGLKTSRVINRDNSTHEAVELSITSAMILLNQAMSEFSSDAVKCVLAETAVALPVKYKSSRKSGRVSFVQAETLPTTTKVLQSGRTKGAMHKTSRSKEAPSSAENLFLQAQKLLRGLETGGQLNCTSDVLHLIYKMQSKLGLLSSTMSVPLSMSSSELVLQSLTSKDISRTREQITVGAERQTKTRAQIQAWPDVGSLREGGASNTILDCTMDDLAEIPESWSVITMSLSDGEQELLMSKIVGGRSPFLLRIPLTRSDLEIDEEAEFSFPDAKTEIMDIVAQANDSAHDSRGQGDREARRAWYAEREELDARLETWLCNVENIWLGGFRGLLSPNNTDETMLVRFGQTLNQILDKHLPSRQKSVSLKVNKVALHAHVLELFLGLGDPDVSELDDAATDLLYFVVDILQFSGEQNAYDEIDFDAILVDVLDAMRACHASSVVDDHHSHTILIVDKELASFPWESLPCLQDRSVSRMPSLSSLIERLRKVRDQSPTADCYKIPADNGAYVLNPSSDLVSTQDTFQPVLESQLSTYTSKINAKPSESEFTSLLTSHSLLLYFGHGSGAQYIRGRTIRSLDSCAVTLLMGCSSAKMTECGKFESYGMPGYYINGMSGCMAVVGTLWDVTDRDIDRFAMKLMVEWGLIDETDQNVQKALDRSNRKMTKRKGKAGLNVVSKDDKRGEVSLDEAVRRGRDACLLRYLNGAAPIVYGVPVFLE